ncbi:MAG: aquaporin [Halobacteriales archaeon]|nr:aquaporin [Halobacteriales archaeon]
MSFDWRPEAAEAVGVFLLVFFGCGAVATDAIGGGLGHLGVSLAFAFAVLVLVYALAPICGAHYNPAVTLAFAATGHFPWRRVPTYLVAQVLGATLAALALKALGAANLGTTMPHIPTLPAFAWETAASFILGLVIIGVATDKRTAPGSAGLAIGFTVGMASLVAGPLTGASMNPARTLGPALASGTYTGLWIYLTAPFLGAVAAMTVFEALRPGTRPVVLGVAGPLHLSGEAEA